MRERQTGESRVRGREGGRVGGRVGGRGGGREVETEGGSEGGQTRAGERTPGCAKIVALVTGGRWVIRGELGRTLHS